MMFRLCAAGFALLLVLVSWLAIRRWYWYGDIGLKHKHHCALQLQTINMGLNKVSRALLVKLFFFFFFKRRTIVLLLFASITALKNTERSSFRTGVGEHDSEVRINWPFGNCSWERLTANCARNCWRSYCCHGWQCWTQCAIFTAWRSSCFPGAIPK